MGICDSRDKLRDCAGYDDDFAAFWGYGRHFGGSGFDFDVLAVFRKTRNWGLNALILPQNLIDKGLSLDDVRGADFDVFYLYERVLGGL